MLQKPILQLGATSKQNALLNAQGLEAFIRNLPPTMVASLDQRIQKLQQLAQTKCQELQTSKAILEETEEVDLTQDEQLLLAIFRLIDYIEYLQG